MGNNDLVIANGGKIVNVMYSLNTHKRTNFSINCRYGEAKS